MFLPVFRTILLTTIRTSSRNPNQNLPYPINRATNNYYIIKGLSMVPSWPLLHLSFRVYVLFPPNARLENFKPAIHVIEQQNHQKNIKLNFNNSNSFLLPCLVVSFAVTIEATRTMPADSAPPVQITERQQRTRRLTARFVPY